MYLYWNTSVAEEVGRRFNVDMVVELFLEENNPEILLDVSTLLANLLEHGTSSCACMSSHRLSTRFAGLTFFICSLSDVTGSSTTRQRVMTTNCIGRFVHFIQNPLRSHELLCQVLRAVIFIAQDGLVLPIA